MSCVLECRTCVTSKGQAAPGDKQAEDLVKVVQVDRQGLVALLVA